MKSLNGGGPLVDLGVHRLDLALWLMGYPRPTWVMGATYNELSSTLTSPEGRTLDVEDMGNALIRLENGASLSLEASWAANVRDREHQETILLGSRGGLVHRNLNNDYIYETELYIDRDGKLEDVTYNFTGQPSDPKLNAMYHFVDSIVRDVPHMCTGEEGLILMETLDAIYRSAERSEPVHVPTTDNRIMRKEGA
jgi:predicted dehydrogenase